MGRDHYTLVVAAGDGVTGDLLPVRAEDDQLVLLGLLQRQHLLGIGRWHRVVVAVIADQAIPTTAAGRDAARVIGRFADQAQQAFLSQTGEGGFPRGTVKADVSNGVEPLPRLGVEVRQVTVGQAEPEVAPYVLDATLDLALRLGAIGLAGARRETVLVGQVQIAWMEAHRAVGLAAQHRRLEIVMQHFTRHAPEVVEGVDVAA